MQTKTKTIIGLSLILLLAVILRFWGLGQYPPGLYPDEAVNAMDGLRAWEAGRVEWYYPNNNGREGLFINLMALAFHFFGASLAVLRAVPALIGSLTVLAVFLVAREFFRTRTALIAAFLVAVSYWHVNFSRIGFRAILVPLILSLSFFFLLKGWRELSEQSRRRKGRKKQKCCWPAWASFLAAGLVFGVGFHTYIAFRVAPAIVAVFFGLILLNNLRKPKQWWPLIIRPVLVFGLGVFLTAAPLLYFFMANPESLNARQNDNSISVFDPQNNRGNLVGTIAKNLVITLGQFGVIGDRNFRHNLAGRPELDPLTAIAFAAALIALVVLLLMSLIKSLKLQWKKPVKPPRCLLGICHLLTDPDQRLVKYGTLLAWFFLMLSPAFLTVEGLPHALRSIGSLVPAYILAAAAFDFALGKKIGKAAGSNFFKNGLIYLALAFIACYGSLNYFETFGKSAAAAGAFERRLVNIGQYLKESTPSETRYLVVNIDSKKINTGFPVSLETTRFMLWSEPEHGAQLVQYILPENLYQIEPQPELELVLQKEDSALQSQIEERLDLEAERVELTPQWGDTGFIVMR